ncbi:hypothetical protein J3458_021028 [Metarhizium acridum]|nr:hypothetical protein J3458_021028 [Metarhizium acridum]
MSARRLLPQCFIHIHVKRLRRMPDGELAPRGAPQRQRRRPGVTNAAKNESLISARIRRRESSSGEYIRPVACPVSAMPPSVLFPLSYLGQKNNNQIHKKTSKQTQFTTITTNINMCEIQTTIERCPKCKTDTREVEQKHWCQEAKQNGQFRKCKTSMKEKTEITWKPHRSCQVINLGPGPSIGIGNFSSFDADAGIRIGSLSDHEADAIDEAFRNMERHADSLRHIGKDFPSRADFDAFRQFGENMVREGEALSRLGRDIARGHNKKGKGKERMP